ncbi:hypothetical protein TEQG_00642 [Trichophyton equinum CBS 127.97]|uniref:Uncharacterized protein n=1 Tax=Trichophyton equinum (strain ATCC MYA-4606 / CBS 127.97) TaxID=559882 RepID=F2PI35_TRIEC|nr:hypothetical protein TEQG_00642 [Trichophyton equinum CBS 127.97]
MLPHLLSMYSVPSGYITYILLGERFLLRMHVNVPLYPTTFYCAERYIAQQTPLAFWSSPDLRQQGPELSLPEEILTKTTPVGHDKEAPLLVDVRGSRFTSTNTAELASKRASSPCNGVLVP